tara:strand:+ start:1342 stop:1992 length:651 start_codon:yes stop_codon:yes gene_type:complete
MENFNKAKRCNCRNTTNNKVCSKKSKTLYNVDNKLYCINHYRYYRNSYATKIQSIYKGYKQRKLINIIYKRLPEDLQYKILYYVKRNTYQKRYIKKLKDILDNKFMELYNDIFNIYYLYPLNNKFSYNIIKNKDKILQKCYLYNKYFEIVNYRHKEFINHSIVNKLSNIIKYYNTINVQITQDGINIDDLYDIYNKITFLIKPWRTIINRQNDFII